MVSYLLFSTLSGQTTVSDYFWLKRMTLWTNDVPLGTEWLFQSVMCFCQKYQDPVLLYRECGNEVFFSEDFPYCETILSEATKLDTFRSEKAPCATRVGSLLMRLCWLKSECEGEVVGHIFVMGH